MSSLIDEIPGAAAAAAALPDVTQLDFNQAMADFHIMFPEMDQEVIEVVLRSNKGAVDATIDQLLIMMVDNEQQQAASTAIKKGVITSMTESKYIHHAHFMSDKPHSRLQPELTWQQSLGIQYCNSEGKPIILGRLPPDFLRIDNEGAFGREFRGHDSDFANLGSLLQSPEFVEALRMDRDFMQSLEHESQQKAIPKDFHEAVEDDTEAFKERLTKMGKVSRRKLTQMARVFLRGKKLPLRNSSLKSTTQQPIMCDQDESFSHSNF